MEDFRYGSKTIEFWSYTGEVLGSEKRSDTQVTSSGGGGVLTPQGGYVSPTKVSSKVTLHHDFWLKLKDGTEKNIHLVDVDIPLRIGQRVSLICAGRKGKGSGEYSVLVNHQAGKHWHLLTPKVLAQRLSFYWINFVLMIVMFSSFLGLLIDPSPRNGLFGWGGEEWGVAFLLSIALLTMRSMYCWRRNRSLKRHLESLAQNTYGKA